MKIEEITRTVLTATDGFVLTNGKTYGKVIVLAVGANPYEYYEITESEYEALKMSERLENKEI